MTKEQWLENMQTDTPDYKGLLKERDKDLLKYLMKGILETENPKVIRMFIDNIIKSADLDWLVDGPHKIRF
jgi:succinate dehydrogenase flavin-adding protein (antitoxin of CptAB toxin-antitoxin module)